jgi:hypothetical protein
MRTESFLKRIEDLLSGLIMCLNRLKKNFLRKTNFDKDFLFSDRAINWMNENNARLTASGLTANAYTQ